MAAAEEFAQYARTAQDFADELAGLERKGATYLRRWERRALASVIAGFRFHAETLRLLADKTRGTGV